MIALSCRRSAVTILLPPDALGLEVEDEGLHFGQAAVCQLQNVPEMADGLLRVLADLRGCGMSRQRNAVKGLRDPVVQLAAKALPFFDRSHVLRTSVELRVFHRDRRLVCQRQGEARVSLVKMAGIPMVQPENANDAPLGNERHAQP